MSGYRTATCRGRTCHAPIVWATTKATGKSMPVDAEPDDDGNVELVPNADPSLAPWAIVHATAPLVTTGTLHTPHHMTCPDAGDFRR